MSFALPLADKIHISSSPTVKDRVSVIQMGDGYEQRIETGINPQRQEWSIIWPALSKTEFDSLMVTLNTVRCVTAMDWQPPTSSTSLKFVRVVDSLNWQKVGDGLWRVSCSLRQVFES
jgi:phage-related protein